MIQGEITKERMAGWKFVSSEEPGLHEVIAPGKADCQEVWIYRLNLPAGQRFCLKTGEKEMAGACIRGSARVAWDETGNMCEKLDSFYAVRDMELTFEAREDSVFYIGGAVDEGYGIPYFRRFDSQLPIGEIHQIHGQGVGRREVFMTVNPEVMSSRLLAGLTWGENGTWTSWPPHQHEKDLEEVYCYFDMDAPHFGLHLSYMKPGEIHGAVVHTVNSGTMVLAPCGYHPTVGSPGTQNAYFWVLAAHSHKSRRYDLAVADPERDGMN